MNPHFITYTLKNERLLEKYFVELAMANPGSAAVLIEIARRHRENVNALENIVANDLLSNNRTEETASLIKKMTHNIMSTVDSIESGELGKIEVVGKDPSLTITNTQKEDDVGTKANSTRKRVSKKAKTNIIVEFVDGTVIKRSKAKDVFVDALKYMGLAQVKRLGIFMCGEPLVADFKSSKKRYAAQQAECGGLYIFTYTSTQKKKVLLENIAWKLGVEIQVILVNT